jgi:ABC-type uncharacterized transport system substrate-binding protein
MAESKSGCDGPEVTIETGIDQIRVSVSDPVASGIVPKFNQPGGNITGFANYEASLGGKWLELLSEIAPGLKRTAIVFNPDIAAHSQDRRNSSPPD